MDYSQESGELNLQQPKTYNFLGQEGSGYLKMLTFPLGRNAVLLRLENLFDTFDGESQVEHVDVEKVAMHLFWKANPTEVTAPFTSIQEVDISNNMLAKDADAVRASKQWKGEDDEKIALKLSQDEKLRVVYEGVVDDVSKGTYAGIALQPQRIR